MIIECGKRRIVSYPFGWRIEIQILGQKGKSKGKLKWVEDRPAYPATLASACQNVYERILKDEATLPADKVPDALQRAYTELEGYMEKARKLGEEA